MSYEFTLQRLIDASPEAVFDAMTDPRAQRRWWTAGRSEVRASADLRVGGAAFVEWTADEGHLCRADQVFREIGRPHRLVFTETVTEPGSPVYECLLTFSFEEQEGKTFLTLHHTGFPTAEERDKHQRGTGIFLDRLERFVTGDPTFKEKKDMSP